MIIARPYKDKILNILMILIEVCISVCYTSAGCLLFSGVKSEDIMWAMFASIYMSYFLHSFLGYYKMYHILYPLIRNCFVRGGRDITAQSQLSVIKLR
jgi:hypothetical protein